MKTSAHTATKTAHKLKVVGHRGARGLAPENTVAAIRKALEHGVDELEIDVRVTKDQIVVVHHDATCRDAAGNVLRIATTAYNELKRHKPNLATLTEAISATNRHVPLQIEVKWGEPTAPVIAVLQNVMDKGWLPTDFLLGSKKQQTIMDIHTALPDIPTVVIEPYLSLRAVWRAKQLGTRRISMNYHGLWGGFITSMSKRGYELYAYPLDDPVAAKRWQTYGLRGVITDRPDLF